MSAFLRLGSRAGSRGVKLPDGDEEFAGAVAIAIAADTDPDAGSTRHPVPMADRTARANVPAAIPASQPTAPAYAQKKSGMGSRRRPPSLKVDASDFAIPADCVDRGSLPVESVSMYPTSFDRKECSEGSSQVYWSRSLRGARRRQCEDIVASHPELHGTWNPMGLFCLFDGHGGSTAAEFASKAVVTHFLHALANQNHTDERVPEALRRAMLETDTDITAAAKDAGGPTGTCGTTAVVAALAQGRLVLAHVGDSRAAVVSRTNPLTNQTKCRFLTQDHKPLNPDEVVRIEDMGGFILNARVNGILAISRALGDQNLKPFVSADPDILDMHISEEDELLILGSDGLWDSVTEQRAAEISADYSMDPERCSRALVEEAWTTSKDDISVVVIHLPRYLEKLEAGGLVDATGDETGEARADISSAHF